MWPDDKEVAQQRAGHQPPGQGTDSDVITFDERNIPVDPTPKVSQMNVYKSKVHLGPKIEVHNNGEIIKGRFFGLDIVQTKHSRRFRCSVAVFVCWALVVATGLAIYLVRITSSKQTRLDLDLPFPQYIWDSVKTTSKAERLICSAAILTLIVCLGMVIYFVSATDESEDTLDIAPHEWNITRSMWLAQGFNNTPLEYDEPLKLVIIQHTVSTECHKFKLCAAELRNMQSWFITSKHQDIPYNFLIGNDGRVYEGRGWRTEGAHTKGYNRCSLGIGFIGDYREEQTPHTSVTNAQLARCQQLLQVGVTLGRLDPNYVVAAAMDLQVTASPGSNLYNALVKWPNYDHEHRYKNANCTQIMQKKSTAQLT